MNYDCKPCIKARYNLNCVESAIISGQTNAFKELCEIMWHNDNGSNNNNTSNSNSKNSVSSKLVIPTPAV